MFIYVLFIQHDAGHCRTQKRGQDETERDKKGKGLKLELCPCQVYHLVEVTCSDLVRYSSGDGG